MLFNEEDINDALISKENQSTEGFHLFSNDSNLLEYSNCYDDTSLPFSDSSNFSSSPSINDIKALELPKCNHQLTYLIPPIFAVARISKANIHKRMYTNASKKMFKDKISVHEAIVHQLLETREDKLKRYRMKKHSRMRRLGIDCYEAL